MPDFSNSVLVHRSAIEELNSQIKVWRGEWILVSLLLRLWPGNEASYPAILCCDPLSLQGLGEGKLVSMEECKDFKRGIHMLEW